MLYNYLYYKVTFTPPVTSRIQPVQFVSYIFGDSSNLHDALFGPYDRQKTKRDILEEALREHFEDGAVDNFNHPDECDRGGVRPGKITLITPLVCKDKTKRFPTSINHLHFQIEPCLRILNKYYKLEEA